MNTAHRRQGRAKQALRQMDLLEFFYPGPPPDDRNGVDMPEPPKGQPQQPQEQGDAA